jgi:hypothetical protein
MRLLLLAAAGIGLQAVPMNILNPSFELGSGQFGTAWQGTCGSCGVYVDSGFDFTSGPPDGTRTMYVNSTVGVHQVLSDVVMPNMVYTIEVMIGDRLFVPFGGSDIRLYSSASFTTFAAATFQTHFDMVVGDMTPTPEPGAWVMVVGAGLVIASPPRHFPAGFNPNSFSASTPSGLLSSQYLLRMVAMRLASMPSLEL